MRRLLVSAGVIGALAAATLAAPVPRHMLREAVWAEPAHRANALFQQDGPNFDPAIHRLAQRIEWGDAPTPADLAPIGARINARHGQDGTLLFHAVASGNLAAVDALLAAGADPDMPDKATGSSRSFVYVLTLPGGTSMNVEAINRMIASYLRHGGAPSATFGDPATHQGNLLQGLALIGNLEGLRAVLAAGGDAWKRVISNGRAGDNAMDTLGSFHHFAMLDELIEKGFFDARSQAEIHAFLICLGGYAQRQDEPSREIQRIAMRVLKRNPHYVETATYDIATRRIFQAHWQDSAPGIIPWEEIRSDAVR